MLISLLRVCMLDAFRLSMQLAQYSIVCLPVKNTTRQ